VSEKPTRSWVVWEEGDAEADGYSFLESQCYDADDAAELAADLYHGDGGGEWQTGHRVFIVRAPDGGLSSWNVYIDYSPFFTTEASDGG